MNFTPRLWIIIAGFLGLLAFWQLSNRDGSPPAEKTIFEALKVKAEKGDIEAQCQLGKCYEDGVGVAKNGKEAAVWYRKAAERGYDFAQFNLAYCYERGLGVPKDFVQAVLWYRNAAEQGHGLSQACLGMHLEDGVGVPSDKIEAYAYFNLAAITHELGVTLRGDLERKMTKDEIAAGQKRSTELQKEIEAKMNAKNLSK